MFRNWYVKQLYKRQVTVPWKIWKKLKYLGTTVNVRLINQNYFHGEFINGLNLVNV
jgi:hypothetical protein